MTARYREARWALLAAHARFEAAMARVHGRPSAALVLWAEICELRREHYRLEQLPS
jgi:superfamily I DNA and RNA helicase